jgi:hypothetical protein
VIFPVYLGTRSRAGQLLSRKSFCNCSPRDILFPVAFHELAPVIRNPCGGRNIALSLQPEYSGIASSPSPSLFSGVRPISSFHPSYTAFTRERRSARAYIGKIVRYRRRMGVALDAEHCHLLCELRLGPSSNSSHPFRFHPNKTYGSNRYIPKSNNQTVTMWLDYLLCNLIGELTVCEEHGW